MTQTRKELWMRLRDYHFDHLATPTVMSHLARMFGGVDASTKAFANKLSRKLGWTTRFALRAIAEYRKFVYLGVTSDFSVTPSKVIDQVWHEHLLFTQGYAAFCREVLRVEFHHYPELVPIDEQTGVFQAQYRATLDLYRREFNQEPPADIWSVPKFKGESAPATAFQPRKKSATATQDSSAAYQPLWMWFDGDGGWDNDHHHHGSHGHDGGHHDGSSSSGDGHSSSGGDSGGSGAGGSSGGDGGGGCSGGSGCSGGCGGGCGGS
jgi:uncharacterized membrane protein YgcG